MTSADRKLDAWKKKLLDLGKRNRLINYHDTKRSNLRIIKPGFLELWSSFVLDEKPIEFPYYEDVDTRFDDNEELFMPQAVVQTNQSINEQQKTLRNLRSKTKTVMEEQGVNVLYLAFGFLKWTESENSDTQLTSPIILVPVSLTWESITAPFVLSLHEDEIVFNPTLGFKLENDYGIVLPEFNTENSIDVYLLNINDTVARNGWHVELEVGLSLFSFLKINMYRDLENHRDSIIENLVVRSLCGDTTAIDRSAISIVRGFDHDLLEKPVDLFQVVDADSSQQDAILCAKRGLSFILQGPPGTGKSQTITNIIAESLAAGKKVLFVSEKLAALEVVRRRLEGAGLSDFCLTLHSHKANKKDVLEQLRSTLNLAYKNAALSDEAFQRLQILQSDRDHLNEYAKQIFLPVQPLNKTLYEVFGSLAHLQSVEDIIFQINDVSCITPEKLNSHLVSLTQFVSTIGKMSDDYTVNPWFGANIKIVSNELRHDIGANVGLLIQKLENLSDFVTVMSDALNLHVLSSYDDLLNILPILKVAEKSPIIPVQWMGVEHIESLFVDAQRWNTQKMAMHALITELNEQYKAISIIDNQIAIPAAITIDTLCDTGKHIALIQQILNENSAFSLWNQLPNMHSVISRFDDFQNRVGIINEQCSSILELYEPEIFEIDYKRMTHRFKSEYTSILKVFKPQYRADKKEIQGLLRNFVKKIEDLSILSMLASLREVDNQRIWIRENDVELTRIFGIYYFSEKTDFDKLSSAITIFSKVSKCQSLLIEIRAILDQYEKCSEDLRGKFDLEYLGVKTNWEMVQQKLTWAAEFRKAINKTPVNQEFVEYVCQDASAGLNCNECYLQLSSKLSSFDKEFLWYTSLFDKPAIIKRTELHSLRQKLLGCKDNLALLEEWIDFRTARKNCEENGFQEYMQIIETRGIPSDSIIPIFKKRFYRMWLDAVLPNYPAVMNFRRRMQESKIADFSMLDKLQFEIAKARIKQKLINELPSLNHFTSGVDEFSILKRELSKQRKIMPIRKLFQAIPNLIPILKPCLMMSPLSVSLFLEAESYHFDTVIFDEASQVCTENAIGAISRGAQVIIAGDSHQLPPTNFFNAAIDDTDFDDDVDEDDDAGAFESVLDEAALMPELTLQWHYRSRHEHLIAFSNAQIYHNDLITFPSNVDRAPDVGVEYIYVPTGVYDRGGKKGNANEAQKVAELVFDHFKKFPNRSLGVIAFGETQQQAIDSAVRKIRLANQQYEPFFFEDSIEPFFIKNLENVQGDERDTIIFSIGYAKDSAGKMHMNFGPLSKSGGERRLNVAITRAKFNIKLVGSILSADIDIDRVSAEGPKLLRSYIDFALNGPKSLLAQISESGFVEHDSPFEQAVYNFLDRKGYKIATQVGCSGYRIDMAIKHPTISGRYVLGIECDGASYHSARTARERDRLRQAVLEDMGWVIYRIWSTDWIKDPMTEGQKLIDSIESVLQKDNLENDIQSYYPDNNHMVITDTPKLDFLSVNSKVISQESQLNPYGFAQYQVTTFSNVPCDSYGYVKATDCIFEVVNTEYPIHYDLLCQKLACLYGNEKVTIKIRREVDYALSNMHGKLIRKGDYFYPYGYTDIPVRIPNIRKINHISIDELEQAMLTIARNCIGTTSDGLIAETIRVYGFNRAGVNITDTMNQALKNLFSAEKLNIIDGKIAVSSHCL